MGKKDTLVTILFLLTHPGSWRDIKRWRRSLAPDHTSITDRLPWVTFGAIDWMDGYLNKDSRVFEYGSGGSTLFLLDRSGKVTSVEHDKDWYEEVKKKGEQASLLLRTPEPVTDSKEFTSVRHAGFQFEHYVRSIKQEEDQSLDLVIVDGRARNQCVKAALPKIKPGGYLLLDNSDRERYAPARALLSSYERTDFRGLAPYCNQPSQTSVWKIN